MSNEHEFDRRVVSRHIILTDMKAMKQNVDFSNACDWIHSFGRAEGEESNIEAFG